MKSTKVERSILGWTNRVQRALKWERAITLCWMAKRERIPMLATKANQGELSGPRCCGEQSDYYPWRIAVAFDVVIAVILHQDMLDALAQL